MSEFIQNTNLEAISYFKCDRKCIGTYRWYSPRKVKQEFASWNGIWLYLGVESYIFVKKKNV